ncbi:MAG: ATP-binding protein, partial [Bacteroidota bacterium]
EDHEANIWIASHRHGIAKANVHQPNKAASHVIDYATIERKKAALGDQSGNIWLYSINGLERFDLKKNRITFYDKKYGFGQEAYGSNVLNDGRFFIGYQNTFSLFHPDSLNKSNDVPEPYITNFEVFNKPYVAAEQAVFLKKVNLDWRQNFFSIHFSNKNITLPELDTFAYQLEGIDPNWVYTTNTRFANYTDIASGQYTFKLKSANDNGVRTERPLELQINIATPWWKTWWFYSICSLVALALLRVVYQFQLKKKVAEQEAARLEELDQFKSRIYTNLTHEFRTPLTVIKGATETLKGRLRYKQDEQQLLTIQRNSDQILNLINQILELSKLEGGKQQIDWIQADILLFLKYLTDSFQSLAHQKHIALSFHSSKASLLMDFDKDKLQRIISNLISNALKFTPEYGQIQLSAELFNDASLQVKVSDTGKGIAKTNLSYIFDRFYQVEQSSYEGTGIGLALVKQLTELLEGNIEVKSEPEKGTTFLLNFPIHNNASLTTLAFQPTINIQASIFKETPLNDIEKPLLLLIDDNYDILQYLTKILSFHYQIETARNGQQGIQKALVANPKLILCDVMMPEKDGFEVCETLKNDARTKHIPIILLTARADQEDLIHGLSVQANAYLKKPFDKKELLLTIENLLRNNSALYSPFQEKATPFLEQFKGLVKEHLSDDRLSIELLRRQLHLSRNALNEKIKTATGMTTMQYVKNLRLLHAYYLLQTGNHTVKEVQYECGFPSASAFSQAFKEKFGLPPSEVKYV